MKKQKEKQSDGRTHHPLRHVKSLGALITVPLLHSAGLGNICPEAKGKAGLEMPGLSERCHLHKTVLPVYRTKIIRYNLCIHYTCIIFVIKRGFLITIPINYL